MHVQTLKIVQKIKLNLTPLYMSSMHPQVLDVEKKNNLKEKVIQSDKNTSDYPHHPF